jgi:hypothetical protein
MSALRLYEIANQFKELELLESSEDIPPEVIASTLERLDGEFADKAIAIARFILNLEASAANIAAAAKAMKLRGERVQRRADSIRAYLLFNFQSVGRTQKIETPEITLARRENPPAVQVTDEKSIPEAYWVQPETPPKQLNKAAIKEALANEVAVPGAYLARGERLEIK